MAAMSLLAVLDRGYAMVTRSGTIVRNAAQVRSGDELLVRLARGALDVTVKGQSWLAAPLSASGGNVLSAKLCQGMQ